MNMAEQQRIEDVLQFWFGGDQQINYKTKWFPEGSSSVQAATDENIFNKFSDLLELAMEEKLSSWETQSISSCVALIIVLDQFSRHIFRHLQYPAGHEKRVLADSIALRVASNLHNQPEKVIQLPVAEYVFSLMPLRHTPTIEHLEFILNNLSNKETYSIKGEELLQRFRKQTTRRLQHLQDRAKLEETDEILERHPFEADETNILNNPLVKTTEAFLKKHFNQLPYQSLESDASIKGGKSDPNAYENILMISLSGGVDSMVISKILALLKKSGKVKIDHIIAMHIDYANRPESGREAEYVRQWSEYLGLTCCIRVVNEVTRGITDRDAYEKISRTIRYGFYQENIDKALNGGFSSVQDATLPGKNYRISGIMFGHHLGDVQENVISNVFRGSSPLDLSGMTDTSITNGVHVWRPLLQHIKKEIYDFAHVYGVPYFKDSTPSWSTRGKLRNQLIPLLTEIYGEGCLRNLSNLASESDQVRDLVYQNLYGPFLRSVNRMPCGMTVTILPYVQQPACFWREILTNLMHSMGMGRIRDKAVANFAERMERINPTALPLKSNQYGWLELRKEYHTYLSEMGSLQVVRDGVLRSTLVIYNPATTRNQQQQSKSPTKHQDKAEQVRYSYPSELFKVIGRVPRSSQGEWVCDSTALSTMADFDYPESLASESSNPTNASHLQYGPWSITLAIADSDEIAYLPSQKEKKSMLLADVLTGKFSYTVYVPKSFVGEENIIEVEFALLKDVFSSLNGWNLSCIYDEAISPIAPALRSLSFDLRSTDIRVRDGLPWLLPLVTPEIEALNLGVTRVPVSISFEYTGPSDYGLEYCG